MEEFFRYLGKKAGQTARRGKWLYKSMLGSEEEAIQAEYYVGKELAGKITEQMQVNTEPKVEDLLSSAGERLTERIKNQYRKFKFQSVQSSDINAFALPGGFIFTTDSILKLCNYSEDEIAFVLGHEMGHIVRWHIFNKTIASSSLNFLALVSKPGGLAGSLAVRTLNSLMQSSYSRDQEFEADDFGVRLMSAAGYDPTAAIKVLLKLGETSSDNNVFNYFASHPPVGERIEEVKKVIMQKLNQ